MEITVGLLKITKVATGYWLTFAEGPKQGEGQLLEGQAATMFEAMLLTFYDQHF